MSSSRGISSAALLCLPAGLTAYFAFNSGGFYPGPPAYAAIVLSVVLVLRVALARDPFEGFSRRLALAAGALAAYALLTLLSEAWSHAPGTALVEFDLVLVYLLAMLLFGSIAHRRTRLRLWLRVLAATITAICICGLITRLLPHVWPVTPTIANNRLSFPVTYWNALGLLAVFGIVLCTHFCSDVREPPVARVIAAAALPVLAATLFFTFSRGPIATALVVTVTYALVARPRGLISFLLSAVPAMAVTVVVAYHANVLASVDPTSPAGISQGRHVAVIVVVCGVGAALLRALMLPLDARLDRLTLPPLGGARRWGWAGVAAAAVVAILALSGSIGHEFHRFLRGGGPGNAADLRSRLTDPGNDGRLDTWRVAWHEFETAPAVGAGAGTFEDTWARARPTTLTVHDAHSIYMETLDELGIVGLLLLLTSIVAVLVRVARLARGPDRALYAAVFAVLLAWTVHAGIDWDWEMPVITVVFFALGGYALASRPRNAAPAHSPPAHMRALAGLGGLALAVAPALVWFSQGKLNDADYAFSQGDCAAATQSANASISILGIRPEPYEVLGYCDIRDGRPRSAVAAIDKAISLDPNNWNYRYDLVLARAAAGLDPRAVARTALQMNRLEPLVQQEWQAFRAGTPRRWEAQAKFMARQLTTL